MVSSIKIKESTKTVRKMETYAVLSDGTHIKYYLGDDIWEDDYGSYRNADIDWKETCRKIEALNPGKKVVNSVAKVWCEIIKYETSKKGDNVMVYKTTVEKIKEKFLENKRSGFFHGSDADSTFKWDKRYNEHFELKTDSSGRILNEKDNDND
jgi:hypothetical protein